MTIQTVTLPFPISLNNAFPSNKFGRRYASPRYRRWRTEAHKMILLVAKMRQPPGPVRITIKLTPPDNRRRDADNLIKGVVDSLVSAGVLLGDDQRYVREIRAVWSGQSNKKRPFAVVEVETV